MPFVTKSWFRQRKLRFVTYQLTASMLCSPSNLQLRSLADPHAEVASMVNICFSIYCESCLDSLYDRVSRSGICFNPIALREYYPRLRPRRCCLGKTSSDATRQSISVPSPAFVQACSGVLPEVLPPCSHATPVQRLVSTSLPC